MHAHAEIQKSIPARRRPMYGSVWLALFVLLRDGLTEPNGRGRGPAVRDRQS